jgi:membrane fusion protein, copper/silver efflux system
MKTIINTVLYLATSVTIVSCGSGHSDTKDAAHHHDHHHDHDHDHQHAMQAEVKNLEEVMAQYFLLKDALVASDAREAALGAAAMNREMDALDITPEGHEAHINNIVSEMQDDLSHIAETSDLEHQRAHFESVSDKLYEIIKMTGVHEGTIYRQYCPMAFNDNGAHWLSTEREIRNPYFGNAMLKCGSVKETIGMSTH